MRRIRLACWNVRSASLFMIGPIAGLLLLALTFGVLAGMQRIAFGMVAFSLALFGILIKGEYNRLSRR
jgi:positive regulator of sigma E activity